MVTLQVRVGNIISSSSFVFGNIKIIISIYIELNMLDVVNLTKNKKGVYNLEILLSILSTPNF